MRNTLESSAEQLYRLEGFPPSDTLIFVYLLCTRGVQLNGGRVTYTQTFGTPIERVVDETFFPKKKKKKRFGPTTHDETSKIQRHTLSVCSHRGHVDCDVATVENDKRDSDQNEKPFKVRGRVIEVVRP